MRQPPHRPHRWLSSSSLSAPASMNQSIKSAWPPNFQPLAHLLVCWTNTASRLCNLQACVCAPEPCHSHLMIVHEPAYPMANGMVLPWVHPSTSESGQCHRHWNTEPGPSAARSHAACRTAAELDICHTLIPCIVYLNTTSHAATDVSHHVPSQHQGHTHVRTRALLEGTRAWPLVVHAEGDNCHRGLPGLMPSL